MAPSPPDRREIEAAQLALLQTLLRRVTASNPFYQAKLRLPQEQSTRHSLGEGSPDLPTPLFPLPSSVFPALPFTTKDEIVADQFAHPPFGTNLTVPLARYTRFHQTSGTTGRPLRWLDTPESWSALVDNWVRIYEAAGVGQGDRVYYAFSFGPFIGFWLAFDAGQKIGALCIPGGGLSSAGRLRAIIDTRSTVLCCTPTYALRLAEASRLEGIDLNEAKVRVIIVAGEPGGSVPAIRARIESAWPGARVFDHHGMTEVGPVTYQCPAAPGCIHVIESAYLPEVVDPKTLAPSGPGEPGELVLTTLTRVDSPLLRYRTGDLVKARDPSVPCACGRADMALEGGILGRADDMLIVRGINIFPGAVDAVLGRFPEVAEFQVRVTRPQSLAELEVVVELTEAASVRAAEILRRVESGLHASFNLRIPVRLAPPGALPRFEMKARRWVFD